jgi:serine-type D-Ala-D-Ala carboxypeptidase
MIYRDERWTRRSRLTAIATLLSIGAGAGLAQRGETGTLAAVRAVAPDAVNAVVDAGTAPVTATVSATAARMAEDRLSQAERLVQAEVRRGAFPGAALAAGRGAQMAMMKGIGNAEWGRYEVDAERTIYDIASLTKVVGTTTAVMLLVEDGRWRWTPPSAATSRRSPAGTRTA